MSKTLLEKQYDPTGKPTGRILMVDRWGFKEIPIDTPILSHGATVGAGNDIDRENTISVLTDVDGDSNPRWISFEAQQVWLVFNDRFNEDGTPKAIFAS
ncbi:hypothetical protein [Enterococcus gilvus]|uniref:Uncharacterized protein n=1 Tax=Enterococcus gilvus ATCC BAA-350 TaxID=1158614 RepID=R2VF45_9ENTE|nr:hypothetical protein [Enterococcus gilvus]EOI56261.1 hypothetical protein UKC_02159 [Enterococcus gilvus ATCC BAA-350]EOW82489.1 hypothetical protein I592_01808 [Enterococcus gilvus ATCC BAA-350]OJG44425.1 hypothetical protein RV02_GL000031 [Enterococcus gilvus]